MILIGNIDGPNGVAYAVAMPDRESLAAFVRQRRVANRLNQRALAELAGVGVRLVSEVERGKPTVRMDVVNRLLAVFGKELGVVDAPRDPADWEEPTDGGPHPSAAAGGAR